MQDLRQTRGQGICLEVIIGSRNEGSGRVTHRRKKVPVKGVTDLVTTVGDWGAAPLGTC